MKHIDEETLSMYIDGELPSPQVKMVKEHLAGCLPCRRLLEEYGSFGEALRQEEAFWDTETFTRTVMDKINASGRQRRLRSFIPAHGLRSYAAVAAVLLLVLGGGAFLERVQFRQQIESQTGSLVASHYTSRMGDLGAFVEIEGGKNQSAR